MTLKRCVCLLVLLNHFSSFAQLVPFSLISDNMVLQRNIPVSIWGTAVGSSEVTIQFAGMTKKATVVDGKWIVKLDAEKENSTPQDLTIKTDKESLVYHNIVVGDVWIAGGQSNMSRNLGLHAPQKPLDNWEAEAAQADYPLIREFSVPVNSDVQKPVTSINSKWAVCNPKSVLKFSAVGYYFAKTIHQQINVPIGIINSSCGGTEAEKWISKEALEANPDFKSIVDAYNQSIANYPKAMANYKAIKDSLFSKWLSDSTFAAMNKKPIPKQPTGPWHPLTHGNCGGLYKNMIEPLLPYPIKGVIWYQGEANVGNPALYSKLFPALIADWRAKWGVGDFPFLCVQLAPYKTNTPEIREVQMLTVEKVKNTAMVVTLDCGDTTDIHPPHKQIVGARLGLAARAIAYNEKKLEYSGPIYKSYSIKDGKVLIEFTHVGKGLEVKGDSLIGFTISENGKDFVQAKAIIENKKVVVSAEGMANPVAVRYAFVNCAYGNLFNKDGLPASPFRTDVH